MDWRPVLSPSELTNFRELLPHLNNNWLLERFVKIINGLSRVLGYPLYIELPADVANLEGKGESLRAMRIIKKLRDAHIVVNSYDYQHEYADEPNSHVTILRLSENDRIGMSGKSAHLSKKSATLWPAIGELIERYSIEHHEPEAKDLIKTSWDNLHEPKVDVFNIAGFDEVLKQKGHFHFNLSYDSRTEFTWTRATDLVTETDVWAPLQWFSFKHSRENLHYKKQIKGEAEAPTAEPMLSPSVTTGAAAGQDKKMAILNGLCEIVERDAFMIYWLNQLVAYRIDLDTIIDQEIQKLLSVANDYRLNVNLLYLQTDVPLHTICITVIDRTGAGPALMLSAKTGFDVVKIITSLLQDTLAQRGSYRRMQEKNKTPVPSLEEIYKIDHAARMHIWFQTKMLSHLDNFISGDYKNIADLPKYSCENDVNAKTKYLVKFFSGKGYEVFYRELISPELKDLTEGLSTVMVKVPQMTPLYLEESLRAVGGKRLREVPKLLGYEVDEKLEDPFSKIPHPFP